MKRYLVLVALLLNAGTANAAPFWWDYVEKMSNKAWQQSLECRCEQSFAVDLTDNGIQIRWFKNVQQEYHTQVHVLPSTVALFHTHVHDFIPSPQDREVEKQDGIPVYIIHGSIIVEAKP